MECIIGTHDRCLENSEACFLKPDEPGTLLGDLKEPCAVGCFFKRCSAGRSVHRYRHHGPLARMPWHEQVPVADVEAFVYGTASVMLCCGPAACCTHVRVGVLCSCT